MCMHAHLLHTKTHTRMQVCTRMHTQIRQHHRPGLHLLNIHFVLFNCRSAVLQPTTRFLGALLLPHPRQATPLPPFHTSLAGPPALAGAPSYPARPETCSGPSTSAGAAFSGAFAAGATAAAASAATAHSTASANNKAAIASGSATHTPLSCQQLLLASLICNVGEGAPLLELPKPLVNPQFQVGHMFVGGVGLCVVTCACV